MAFFRTLFNAATPNKFPEFTEFLNSVDNLRAVGSSIIEETMIAFSDPFLRFAASQSSEMRLTLESIKEAGDSQTHAMRHLWNELTKLPADLGSLRAKNLEFQTKQRELEAAKELAKASRAAVPKTQEALDRAERKGNQAEIHRLVERLEQAKQKANEDEAAAESSVAAFEEFQAKYPGEFTDLVSSMLGAVADTKIRELDALSSAADAFIEASGKFHESEDPAIERLQKRIEELDAALLE
jgi:predicted  nucleic acid-binding Zn-ribbon protein